MLINEIFTSIDGEVNKWGQGTITTFIRLQGCNLRCSYCDTPKALEIDDPTRYYIIPVKDIVQKVEAVGCRKVTITGGEPLGQEEIWQLLSSLQSLNYNISIETNGTHAIPIPYLGVDNICWIVDYKMEYDRQMKVNYANLSETDWIKFVVPTGNILEVFNKIKEMREEGIVARIAVSSVDQNPKWLLDQLIGQRMFDVSLNVQLHKLINVI